MKKTANFYVLCLFLASSISFAQDVKEKHEKAPDSLAIYLASESAIYPVYDYVEQPISNTPKNIILMIGDGMGLTQISAGQTANKGEIFLQNFKHIGFCKTHSSNSYTTDSAAGGTALSTGVKTYNGAVGVDQDKKPIANVCEMAHHIGLKTGIISTSSITDATPAAFLAHQPSRKMHEEIALDCTNSSVDIIIGTGYKYFTNRKDKKNLLDQFEKKNYQLAHNIADIKSLSSGKIAGIIQNRLKMPQRGNFLTDATKKSIEILSEHEAGFFMMVEGAMIDWAGHNNNANWMIQEFLDFDKTIGAVLEFASKNKETLVIVTADHETGGLSICEGNLDKGMVKASYATGGHTGVMVPIFAFGPGAENFTGIMDNTTVAKKMIQLLNAQRFVN